MCPPTISTMRIERVEPSKHKKNRILVFLEGGQLLKITENELLHHDLRPGADLPEKTVEELAKCFLLEFGDDREFSFGRCKDMKSFNELYDGLKNLD